MRKNMFPIQAPEFSFICSIYIKCVNQSFVNCDMRRRSVRVVQTKTRDTAVRRSGKEDVSVDVTRNAPHRQHSMRGERGVMSGAWATKLRASG